MYLNYLKSLLYQFMIFAVQLLQVWIIELRIRLASGTHIPTFKINVNFYFFIFRMFLLLNTLRLGLKYSNTSTMEPVSAILTSNIEPKEETIF